LGNGESTGRTFDLDGRITADPVETTTYDADSRVTTRTLGSLSVLADTQSFSYDSLSQLVSYSGNGGSLSFSYDPSGNRTVQIKNTVQTTYAIDPASNRILSSQRQSGGSDGSNESQEAVVPEIVIGGSAPVIDISVNPSSIYLTQSATLTWTTYYGHERHRHGNTYRKRYVHVHPYVYRFRWVDNQLHGLDGRCDPKGRDAVQLRSERQSSFRWSAPIYI
jgi:YD repeat-containing protein